MSDRGTERPQIAPGRPVTEPGRVIGLPVPANAWSGQFGASETKTALSCGLEGA